MEPVRTTRAGKPRGDLAQGRGRHAEAPQDIPLKGWLDVLRRFGAGFLDDHTALVAAGVAYYSLLALFPAIVLFVSLYGLIADPTQAAEQAIKLATILPDEASEFLYREMIRLADAPISNLGVASLASLAIAFWGSNRSVKALFEALNIAYQEKERRNLLRINLLAFAFTAAFIFFGFLTVVLVVAVPPLLDALYLPGAVGTALSLLRWPILFGGMVLGTSLLYKFGPHRAQARFAWVGWGSVLAGLLWLLASALISWYAASFADFNKTYGSLGAVVVLQIWIWVTALVIITGAKVNAEAEHQTAVDTTTGPPEPMGRRGAIVADTLGRTWGKKKD